MLRFTPDSATAIAPTSSAKSFYLLRAPKDQLANKAAYQYFSGAPTSPAWSASRSGAVPVFTDVNGVSGASIVYDAAIHRYVLTLGHGSDAGNLGIFEAPEPWGPWSTVAYEDRWLGINSGEYLGVRTPSAWISGDGLGGLRLLQLRPAFRRSLQPDQGHVPDCRPEGLRSGAVTRPNGGCTPARRGPKQAASERRVQRWKRRPAGDGPWWRWVPTSATGRRRWRGRWS
jgi:hypothetical protein